MLNPVYLKSDFWESWHKLHTSWQRTKEEEFTLNLQMKLNMIIIPITVMGFVVNIPDISDMNGLPSTSEHVEHLRWEPLFTVIYVTCVQFQEGLGRLHHLQ